VLDHRGDLAAIKLQSGRQAFLAKLQQLVTPATMMPISTEVKPALPADRPRGFAAAAHQRINGALLRCEERYPNDAPHSVLYVVVDKDAVQWREKLNSLHNEFFGPDRWDPLAPVKLEVIDRSTDEALQRLIDSGLLAKTTRATRPLWPENTSEPVPLPLSEIERQQAATHRHQAARKLKMARLLGEGGLDEETRTAMLEAVLPLSRALAIENRLPEPGQLDDALLAPLAQHWGAAITPLRQFTGNSATPWRPVLDSLSAI
jgi:hypothetical protein